MVRLETDCRHHGGGGLFQAAQFQQGMTQAAMDNVEVRVRVQGAAEDGYRFFMALRRVQGKGVIAELVLSRRRLQPVGLFHETACLVEPGLVVGQHAQHV